MRRAYVEHASVPRNTHPVLCWRLFFVDVPGVRELTVRGVPRQDGRLRRVLHARAVHQGGRAPHLEHHRLHEVDAGEREPLRREPHVQHPLDRQGRLPRGAKARPHRPADLHMSFQVFGDFVRVRTVFALSKSSPGVGRPDLPILTQVGQGYPDLDRLARYLATASSQPQTPLPFEAPLTAQDRKGWN